MAHMAAIDPQLQRRVDDIIDAAADLNPGDNMTPGVLAAIAKHAGNLDVRRSVETGAGGSTLLFSHLSARHTSFAIEGERRIITRVKTSLLFNPATTDFVEGPTQTTLPRYNFDQPLQAALLDGPHAFPFPQLEYFHLYPHLTPGALLILDDIHIRTIHELYSFLCADEMFDLIEVNGKTAFFRRTAAPLFDPRGDGWWLQAYNKTPLWRYVWREKLRNSLPAPLLGFARSLRLARSQGLKLHSPQAIRLEAPREGQTVGATTLVCGRAALPPAAFLWVFAKRSDAAGWWPQAGASAAFEGEHWTQLCKLGDADSNGHAFDIAAVAVDNRTHHRILRWFQESALTGRLYPMALPAPVRGARIAAVTVQRVDAATR